MGVVYAGKITQESYPVLANTTHRCCAFSHMWLVTTALGQV